MPDANVLHVLNQVPGATMSFSVDSEGWDCCDQPNPGNLVITGLEYNKAQAFTFCKKGGHGCDGKQGYFVLDINSNGISLGQQGFNMDSDGGLQYTGSSSGSLSKFRSALTQLDGGNFQWLIFEAD